MPRGRRVTFGLHSYGPVLRTPGGAVLLLGALIGRGGHIGGGFAVLFAVHAATGSFGVAGTASGVFAASGALGRVLQGRLVDRRGVSLVLLAGSALFLLSMAALAAASSSGAGVVALLTISAVAGAVLPNVGAVTRVLWATLVPESERRIRAFALDTLVTEVASALGPAAAGVLATTVSPEAGLLAMAALTGGGATIIAASGAGRAAAPQPRGATGALGRPLLLPIAVLFGIGLMAGAVEIAVPAFALSRDSEMATGPLLAAWALGSAVGGLWYGARTWRVRYETRLVACLAWLTLACAALPLAPSVLALGALLAFAGAPIAPTITTLYLLIGERVPRARLTEAFSWLTSSVPIGLALGAALGGWTIAAAGTQAAFALGAGLALVPLAAGLQALRAARTAAREPAAAPAPCSC